MTKRIAVGMNAAYFEQAYEAWKRDPASVSPELAAFFEGFEFARTADAVPIEGKHLQSSVNSLIYHYRAVGHRIADINPLDPPPPSHPELELESFGLSPTDLDQTFDTNHIPGLHAATLREIIGLMRETYCGPIGVEYMHIQERVERRWLQQRMEPTRNRPGFSPPERLRLWRMLLRAQMFEHFLQSTYRGQKRFSLEGAETLIAALDDLVDQAGRAGIVEIVFGMAHRGRLNVLANVLQKPLELIFHEFEDNFIADTYYGDGDVKYHKGFSNDIITPSGHQMHLSLVANPSHLEAVNPVVEGKARAKQAIRNDTARKIVLPLLIHGDAAFAGQGIVAETLNLALLKGYRTGGTIHFIINNQVGFTTSPQDYKSSLYPTDVAKGFGAPVFHVNGDRPEHVALALRLALDYRQTFQKDVVVDMWCYRRLGHNETDEPAFTQPLLYSKIAKHPSVVELYTRELRAAGVLTDAAEKAERDAYAAELERARRDAAEPEEIEVTEEFGGRWHGLRREYSHEPVVTGVERDVLERIARRVCEFPPDFNPHRKIRKFYEDFRDAVLAGGPLSWAQAEILAFGSLLLEGTGVRLSGEDSRRGTFSQRHAAVIDQKTGDIYIPLTNIDPNQAQFCVYDSALAEASVLGFDYGYSIGDPHRLIIWEAQFGDFVNGAQVILDQFIAAAISKWDQYSGLVLFLPHGYEGQGPEHSNAWLARHLRACAENNMEVVQPSTPSQFFHCLRRQMRRNFRRPCIMLTPKSLLRHPEAVSHVEELTYGYFHEILDDPIETAAPRRVLFCSGKLYYELSAARRERGIEDIALVRVEQFYPIWDDLWQDITEKYAAVPEWVWVSEEPTNFGAWGFVHANLTTYRPDAPIWYVGRARSASPATASLAMHRRQQALIIDHALQSGPLQPMLRDGVAVFHRGEPHWRLKTQQELKESVGT
ncbi:MAG: 2-oxoglutarate dehydrogenase E1 component [Candidatus Sumerlaeaceae bacterium]|nr:2-oxoglutarate dehydrogenase E1 component [Candidatus Sumerlaeaceae bacterium]